MKFLKQNNPNTQPKKNTLTTYPNIEAYNNGSVLPSFVKWSDYQLEQLKKVVIDCSTLTIDVACFKWGGSLQSVLLVVVNYYLQA